MKADEKKQVNRAIERFEYYSNYLHKINGASVRITNLKEKEASIITQQP